MRKNASSVYLTAGEFLATARNGLNQQVANARWQFTLSVQKHVPEFFERLRDQVLPVFERLVKPGYWHTGCSFSMWQSRSDSDRKLTPTLMNWARQFHVERETWILEGALQTLSTWNRFPNTRENLEILGFRKPICVPGLVLDHERVFHFEDEGWERHCYRKGRSFT